MDRNQQKAFSLAELLTTACIIGALLSIVPSALGVLVRKNQELAIRDALLAHLAQTRTLSITTHRPHMLCGSSNGTTCDGEWAGHWLIVTPHDNRVHQRYQTHQATSLCWRGLGQHVHYAANGTAPASNGRFALCRDRESVWQLVINRQGRVRLASAMESTNCCMTDHTDS